MRILVGLLLLTACAPVARGGMEDELARTLAGRVPGSTERVSTHW